jgi:hypothetical protein
MYVQRLNTLGIKNIICTVASNKIWCRQGHSLTLSKMLHCKTDVNIITYHYVV